MYYSLHLGGPAYSRKRNFNLTIPVFYILQIPFLYNEILLDYSSF